MAGFMPGKGFMPSKGFASQGRPMPGKPMGKPMMGRKMMADGGGPMMGAPEPIGGGMPPAAPSQADPDMDQDTDVPVIKPEAVAFHDDPQSCGQCAHFNGGQCKVLQMEVPEVGGCNAFESGGGEDGGQMGMDHGMDEGEQQ